MKVDYDDNANDDAKNCVSAAHQMTALLSALRDQVEYYLCRDNLATDAFIVSHMSTTELFIKIELFLGFAKIKAIFQQAGIDHQSGQLEALTAALRTSTLLTVDDDGSRVRPNFRVERNIVIVRNVPSDLNMAEASKFFGEELAGLEITRIRPDIGDHWYIYFEQEGHAVEAVNRLRGKSFMHGNESRLIGTRLKSESLLKQ